VHDADMQDHIFTNILQVRSNSKLTDFHN
jgi:hypothetical protein